MHRRPSARAFHLVQIMSWLTAGIQQYHIAGEVPPYNRLTVQLDTSVDTDHPVRTIQSVWLSCWVSIDRCSDIGMAQVSVLCTFHGNLLCDWGS